MLLWRHMANSMMGNLIYIGAVGWFVSLEDVMNALKNLGFFWVKMDLEQPKDPLGVVFTAALPLTVAERLLLTVFTIYLAYGLIFALRKSGIVKLG